MMSVPISIAVSSVVLVLDYKVILNDTFLSVFLALP